MHLVTDKHPQYQIIGSPNDPNSLYFQMQHFLTWMRERNFSDRTVGNRELYIRYFILWCDERGLKQPQDITRPILERYQRYMFLYRKKDGYPLSTRSQNTRIVAVRAWFKWLTKSNRILYNPASDLELPRLEQRLPKHILTEADVERIMNTLKLETLAGVRDRAVLETLYSRGIRRMELINLNQYDVDYERGTVLIRQGKGKKDRMIPIGERALAWIQKYRDEIRPQWALGHDDGTLFITNLGTPFSPHGLSHMVAATITAAQVNKRGSCHLFRHTMATLMLENGADIRFIQAMLGHAELSTTQIYTQVSIVKLKEIHTLTHPARLTRLENASDVVANELSQMDQINPVEPTAADVLAMLEVEAQMGGG